MSCKITVCRVLEDSLSENQRVNDYELADMLITRDKSIGITLTDEDYPLIWDLKKN